MHTTTKPSLSKARIASLSILIALLASALTASVRLWAYYDCRSEALEACGPKARAKLNDVDECVGLGNHWWPDNRIGSLLYSKTRMVVVDEECKLTSSAPYEQFSAPSPLTDSIVLFFGKRGGQSYLTSYDVRNKRILYSMAVTSPGGIHGGWLNRQVASFEFDPADQYQDFRHGTRAAAVFTPDGDRPYVPSVFRFTDKVVVWGANKRWMVWGKFDGYAGNFFALDIPRHIAFPVTGITGAFSTDDFPLKGDFINQDLFTPGFTTIDLVRTRDLSVKGGYAMPVTERISSPPLILLKRGERSFVWRDFPWSVIDTHVEIGPKDDKSSIPREVGQRIGEHARFCYQQRVIFEEARQAPKMTLDGDVAIDSGLNSIHVHANSVSPYSYGFMDCMRGDYSMKPFPANVSGGSFRVVAEPVSVDYPIAASTNPSRLPGVVNHFNLPLVPKTEKRISQESITFSGIALGKSPRSQVTKTFGPNTWFWSKGICGESVCYREGNGGALRRSASFFTACINKNVVSEIKLEESANLFWSECRPIPKTLSVKNISTPAGLKIGISKQEVRSILGPPPSNQDANRWWTYKFENALISLMFDYGDGPLQEINVHVNEKGID